MPSRSRARTARLAAALAAVATFASPAALGQVPAGQAAPPATGLILGQVLDAATRRGVPGVLVTLSPMGPAPTPIGELLDARPATLPFAPVAGARRSLTAADGRFLFRDLPKGRFTIVTSAPGYVPGAFGQARPQGPGQTIDLDDGEKRGGLDVRVWKYGSIAGTLRDELGDPAVGLSVECLRGVIAGGQRRFTTISTTQTTDDRGMYRIGNLPPGDYICVTQSMPNTVPMSVTAASAAASQSGHPNSSDAYRRLQNSGATAFDPRGVRVGDLVFVPGGVSLGRGLMPPEPDARGRMAVYAPQYYPAATTSAQASLVTVGAGEDRSGIDMRLRLVPALRVGGRVTGPDGPAPFLSVRLVPASGNDMVSEGQAEFARTVSDPSGTFTFLGIPSGQYVLKIRFFPRPAPGTPNAAIAALEETALWAAAPVTVGDSDLTDLAIVLRPGLRVSGRVEFAGARQPSSAELQRVAIRMQSAEGRTSSPIAVDGRVAADGTFRTFGYPAGRYIANVLSSSIPAGWSIRSIVAGGRDISVEAIELSDADVGGVTITFTDKTTELSGSVIGQKGPDPAAEVVVFPADSMAWKDVGVVARRGRVERVSNTGSFVISGLPPGDYFVAAVPGTLPGDRQDPALLASLMRDALRVTLADGGTASLQITMRAR
jgi:hypothetical protein